MLSRIINGSYPDATKLIPTEFSLIVKINLNMIFDTLIFHYNYISLSLIYNRNILYICQEICCSFSDVYWR